MSRIVPAALTIAGSDCSSGAGIQADLKSFQHFGVHGLTALTCVVSETANVVRAVHPVPVDVLADQISLLIDSFPLGAIKTGMLFSAAHVAVTADLLSQHPHIPLVVDPVMIASTGASLLEPDAVQLYHNRLLPLASVITPNLHEAEALWGAPIPDSTTLEIAAVSLSQKFGTAVLLKGGHLPGEECLDLLIEKSGARHAFSAPRIPVPGSHGTGCTLSAAIAAALALGQPLAAAVASAKHYLGLTLRHSYSFATSQGFVHALNQGTAFPQNEA